MTEVELREIEVFLTLAEELHFGRTAERLHLTSSRVSQVVRSLETRLGGALFERTSRRVRFTPLGKQLQRTVHPTVPSFAHHYGHPGVTAIPLTGLPPSETALVWLTKNQAAKTVAFATAASAVIDAHGGP
jgi:hypothetical protein